MDPHSSNLCCSRVNCIHCPIFPFPSCHHFSIKWLTHKKGCKRLSWSLFLFKGETKNTSLFPTLVTSSSNMFSLNLLLSLLEYPGFVGHKILCSWDLSNAVHELWVSLTRVNVPVSHQTSFNKT